MAGTNEMVELKFKMPAGLMLRRARDLHVFAQGDIAELEAANPMINAAWLAQFLAEIVAIDRLWTPKEAIYAMAIATGALLKAAAQARDAVQELYSYVALAWPGSGPRLSAYGRGEYEASRRSPMRMVKLMEKALAQAADDAAALDAVGYTAARRAALEALMNDLQAKVGEQEAAKSSTRLTTEEYYTALNELWDSMVLLKITAKIAFRENYARWALYRLYSGRKPKSKKSISLETAVEGMVGLVEKVEG